MFGWWKITIFGVIFVFALFVWFFLIGFSSNQPGSFFNKGHNAVWIGHEWVGEKKSPAEIQKLVNNFRKYQIDTVFVHVGPFNKDGSIDPLTYKYSINFLEKAKKFDADIQYQAWLGQIRNKIDLADEEIRHNIAKLCMILAEFVGFDGIHIDIEPVWDGDVDFIKLLKECDETLSENKMLSVALAEFIPGSFMWFLEHIYTFENYNSEVNYKNVAEYADQIAVMVYDTGIDNAWFYRWVVQEQTIRVTDLLEDKDVFIAIPAYEDVKDGFNPEIENIENGLKGVVKGLNNFRSNEDSFAGVAIYPYWEIDEEEWGIYDELWLK